MDLAKPQAAASGIELHRIVFAQRKTARATLPLGGSADARAEL
jgi:hypothetical protein